MEVTREEFEEMVDDAIDEVPDALLATLDNVVVLIEDEPPPGEDLLGLYDGIPLTERDSGYTFRVPDRILIFSGPLQRMCADREELVEEIAITVVHEITHHFGIEEHQLHALGWG